MTDPAAQSAIYALWDELADFGAARAQDARNHLLTGLCALVGAQNANWTGAVRMDDVGPGDPVRGWRARVIHFLHPDRILVGKAREQQRGVERGRVDETVLRQVADSGRFRIHRLAELVGPAWFQGDYYRDYYLGMNRADALWAGIPINQDAELYVGIFREPGRPPFTDAERDAAGAALRGLRWFHRQQMLAEGVGVASAPLSPAERQVLRGLLQGQTQKQIATVLGHSPHTTREYARRIFRKYGVSDGAQLMSLWLGR
ncbi:MULTISPECIES: helix-turn-helix transcriptional regulator [Pseudomonadota]|uniref:LuxR family transcriptional regulator n=1 Tax=Fulvimonas soli TaxID=155197 RepID=A0A316I8D4_9GAMM|nr:MULTISPECIES: helix-turn-helix transcriptional regulator [Pseudomonadota]PRE08031.1 helix-turn-helix transcriptional regulator [Burkholderia multivorans]PWK89703.1 LuxR family transcriptional regulator [Fulvimonas soli]TNY27647.1 helix-turn-helix transcriptional regulator [Fulvimonas soli]